MLFGHSLLHRLEAHLGCPHCGSTLHRPRTIEPCGHTVCRICLDQLLGAAAAAQCPACQQRIDDSSDSSNALPGRLVDCYYRLRRQARPTLQERTRSVQSDCTVAIPPESQQEENEEETQPPSSGRLRPLVAESQMTSSSGPAPPQRPAAALDDDLTDSSDTDLDLPTAASLLSPMAEDLTEESSQISRGQIASYHQGTSILSVPETPPLLPVAPSKDSDSKSPPSKDSDSKTPASKTPNGKSPPGRRLQRAALKRTGGGSSGTVVEAGGATVEAGGKRRRTADSRTAAGRELRVLCTGLSSAQVGRVQRAAKQLQRAGAAAAVAVYQSAAAEGGGFTHVVAAADRDGRTARTFKYLAGVAAGAWAVSADWLPQCARAQALLPEADYALAGDTAMPQCSLAGPRAPGVLLRGCQLHLWGDAAAWDAAPAHSAADLRALIEATGATVLDALPEPGGGGSSSSSSSSERAEDGDDGCAGSPARRRAPPPSSRDASSAVPAKYRWLFEQPVRAGRPTVLVSSSDLAGPRSSVALGAIAAAGAPPCRTKTWLFDCISAGRLL